MQKKILEKNPKLDVAVYAVWFNMIPTDARSEWPTDRLADSRVTHFWDAQKVAGRWYASHVTRPGSDRVEWDAFFLYGRPARWPDPAEDAPSHMITWGRTIIGSHEKLQAAFEIEPGLKPNQPSHKIMPPRNTRLMLCPGIGWMPPSFLNLPLRAPSTRIPGITR